MIKVPATKLAEAVEKFLLPGLLRSLAEQQKTDALEKKSS
ncbi:MAG: hypothetical protein K0Q73_5962 [Paenibacillus sp.]|nr:hypothetical protein [Paenibacillus sp.]